MTGNNTTWPNNGRMWQVSMKFAEVAFYDVEKEENIQPPEWLLNGGVHIPQEGDTLIIKGTYYEVAERIFSKSNDNRPLITYVLERAELGEEE